MKWSSNWRKESIEKRYWTAYIFCHVKRASVNWLCQYLSFLNIFFNSFCPVKRAFLNWLCQYLSFLNIFFNVFCQMKRACLNWLCRCLFFLNIFFNRFCLVQKCAVTPYCLYRDSLTSNLINPHVWVKSLKKFLSCLRLHRFLRQLKYIYHRTVFFWDPHLSKVFSQKPH